MKYSNKSIKITHINYNLNQTALPAVVEFLEQVVNGVEVRSHFCLLGPALPHDVDGLGRCGAFTHGRTYERRRTLHLLDDICRQT